MVRVGVGEEKAVRGESLVLQGAEDLAGAVVVQAGVNQQCPVARQTAKELGRGAVPRAARGRLPAPALLLVRPSRFW